MAPAQEQQHPGELIRNAGPQAPQTYGVRICALTRSRSIGLHRKVCEKHISENRPPGGASLPKLGKASGGLPQKEWCVLLYHLEGREI